MSIPEIWDSLIQGPGQMRFFLQPVIAILLGIRDGRLDARSGAPPFFLYLVTGKGSRKEIFRQGWKQITTPFLVAFVFDSVLQIFVIGTYRPLSALFAGILLIAIPYLLARGFSNRLLRNKPRLRRRASP